MPELTEPLRELVRKLKYALTEPINNWLVDGKSIVRATDNAPLVHDSAAHPQSLAIVCDGINFVVRRKMLTECADELESLIAPIEKALADNVALKAAKVIIAELEAEIAARDGRIKDYESQLELWMKRAREFEDQIAALTTLMDCGHPKACWVERIVSPAPPASSDLRSESAIEYLQNHILSKRGSKL